MTTGLAWQVGDVRVTRVEELVAPVPAGYLVTGLTTELIDAQRPWADPFVTDAGELLLSIHTFVVEAPGTTIVVDTCVGNHSDRPLTGDDQFLERLADTITGGLAAVDVVVCTHLHFDHVGWNTVVGSDGERIPAFPNARYLVTQPELDAIAAHDEHDLAPAAIAPLITAGQLDAVTTDHVICDSVKFVPTPGHTPGHVSVLIESGDGHGLITGDATHSPLQFTHPELAATIFDSDSAESTATRRTLIKRFMPTDTLILGTHFAPPTAGRLRQAADGTVWLDCNG